MEASRLGLPAYGGDLNPVPILITKALVEIPPRFAGKPPINPESRIGSSLKTWKGSQGLADDIRFYGDVLKKKAWKILGKLYPSVALPKEKGGGLVEPIAWLWARTVESPDLFWKGYIPLLKNGILRQARKNKPVVWVEPIINNTTQTVIYKVREDGIPNEVTVRRCIATGAPLEFRYLRQQGQKGLIKQEMIGVVAKQGRGRIYLDPVDLPDIPEPVWKPDFPLPPKALGFRVQGYGMKKWSDLFTKRQLNALSTFSHCLSNIRTMLEHDAIEAGLYDDNTRLRDGGSGVTAYADAIITYLAFAIDRCVARGSSLCIWQSANESIGQVFGRQALAMVWDFAESNPFSSSTGNWSSNVEWVAKAVAQVPSIQEGVITKGNALERLGEVEAPLICTDPPYYDNVPYADLSDFFYVWLRHNLSDVWPEECSTILTPKKEELIADPDRAGSKDAAEEHFEMGMASVMSEISRVHNPDFPATIFYAFKQQETKEGATVSTGWETFLQGLVDAQLQITATWPIRTEMQGRLRATESAALASSVVIACRRRQKEVPMETRGGFISALHNELPSAIQLLQEQNIAPVDMAQSAIGPGMRIFSRYSKVVEADGSSMSVHVALAHINEVLGEVLSEEGAELDADSQFALTWYEQFGYEPAPFGDADVLARAKVTAVSGVVEAGIAESRGGKVRLLRREELEDDWSPVEDRRRTDWEAVQHLVRLLERSEPEAAGLLRQLGDLADRARQLAYLLYAVCDKKGWSEEAVAYNGLIAVWPELVRLSGTSAARQQKL